MVIENGGDALLDGVDDQRLGGGSGGLQIQMAVNVPPLAVQHLIEIGGVVAVDGKTPGQCGVNMGMGVDQTRHDDAAPGVHKFRLGVLGLEFRGGAHGHNLAAVGHDAAVRVIAGAVRVPGDEFSVCQ